MNRRISNRHEGRCEDFDLASAQRKRFLREQEDEEKRRAYRSGLITWSELFGDYWEAGAPGN